MTRVQRRNLANLVLQHGFDVLTEFWGEIIDQQADGPYADLPSYPEARHTMEGWHARIIDLAEGTS